MKTTEKVKTGNGSFVWKCHFANLTEEVLRNPGTWALAAPLNILRGMMAELGEIAAEINDPRLNCMMMRLAIYSVSDPSSPDFNEEFVTEYLREHNKA